MSYQAQPLFVQEPYEKPLQIRTEDRGFNTFYK